MGRGPKHTKEENEVDAEAPRSFRQSEVSIQMSEVGEEDPKIEIVNDIYPATGPATAAEGQSHPWE